MYTDIELDKPRRLRFDLRAIRDLETTMGGKPIGQISSELRQLSVTALVSTLWAGLKHEDATLTSNLVTKILEDYLDGHSVQPVLRAIDTALSESGLLKHVDESAPQGNGQPPATPAV